MLALLFFFVALVYSTVGFGGGSSYLALLHWQGVGPALLPIIGLACNLLVAFQGFVQFARAGHFPWRRSFPFLALSAPAAYLGGLFPVHETTFFLLLAIALTAAGCLLLMPMHGCDQSGEYVRHPWGERLAPWLGAGLGLLSGIVGIGGGIFLAPILHLTRWAPAKQVAALAAGFIVCNSASGLAGQLQKNDWNTVVIAPYWPLPVAVLVGGLIGARGGSSILPPVRIRQITGVIILIVAANLWIKIAG